MKLSRRIFSTLEALKDDVPSTTRLVTSYVKPFKPKPTGNINVKFDQKSHIHSAITQIERQAEVLDMICAMKTKTRGLKHQTEEIIKSLESSGYHFNMEVSKKDIVVPMSTDDVTKTFEKWQGVLKSLQNGEIRLAGKAFELYLRMDPEFYQDMCEKRADVMLDWSIEMARRLESTPELRSQML